MRALQHTRPSLLGAALAVALAGAARAAAPAVWLERMNHTLTELDYEGTFAHWQDGRMQMLRIIHRIENGVISERLESLDGSGRELIRSGTRLTCYLPDRREVLVEHVPPDSSLLARLPVYDRHLARFYAIHEGPHMRVDRHDTRLITVMPRDRYRYGYRLWIDRAGMPLKIQLWSVRHGGQVIEQIAFATLTIVPHIPNSAFTPHLSTVGYSWLRNRTAPPPPSEHLAWRALWLPPGFHMATHVVQVMPGTPGPVDHLVYTDGLASVSVFVERRVEPRAGRPVIEAARMGASYVFSTIVDGHRVTAVGQAPALTVRSIATSVRAVPVAATAPPQ